MKGTDGLFCAWNPGRSCDQRLAAQAKNHKHHVSIGRQVGDSGGSETGETACLANLTMVHLFFFQRRKFKIPSVSNDG